jgi:hypothetical protein
MSVDSIVDEYIPEVQKLVNYLVVPIVLSAVALALVLVDVGSFDSGVTEIVGKSLSLWAPMRRTDG